MERCFLFLSQNKIPPVGEIWHSLISLEYPNCFQGVRHQRLSVPRHSVFYNNDLGNSGFSLPESPFVQIPSQDMHILYKQKYFSNVTYLAQAKNKAKPKQNQTKKKSLLKRRKKTKINFKNCSTLCLNQLSFLSGGK